MGNKILENMIEYKYLAIWLEKVTHLIYEETFYTNYVLQFKKV